MNPLAVISKNLRELEKAYAKIKTPETGEKARKAMRESFNAMGLCFPEVDGPAWSTETLNSATSVVVGVDVAVVEQDAPKAKETASVGEVVLTPVSDHEVEVDSAIGGAIESVVEPERVNYIGGWPEVAEVDLVGLAPNRRMLKGTLGDGRMVSLERFMSPWQVGQKLKVRLIRAGASPLYRWVPQKNV